MTAEHAHEHHHATAAFMINHIVANLGVLNVKLHQYHWHVQGPDFFTLHTKFEELYNEANLHFDSFAERLIAIGEKPYSTLEEFIEHAFIQENIYDKKIAAEQMAENLAEDYRTIRDVTTKAIELAEKENDQVSEDMLINYKSSLDRTIWMLHAYLGKDPLEDEEE